jgi:hypothetical protein
MAKLSLPLTTLSEAQRTQALERLALLRPTLEGGVSQKQIAHDHQIPLSTVQHHSAVLAAQARAARRGRKPPAVV